MAGLATNNCPICQQQKIAIAEACQKCTDKINNSLAQKKRLDRKCARYPVCKAGVSTKTAGCSARCNEQLKQEIMKELISPKAEGKEISPKSNPDQSYMIACPNKYLEGYCRGMMKRGSTYCEKCKQMGFT